MCYAVALNNKLNLRVLNFSVLSNPFPVAISLNLGILLYNQRSLKFWRHVYYCGCLKKVEINRTEVETKFFKKCIQ